MGQRRFKANSKFELVLKSLIPFTEENLLLSFKPIAFFNELEKTTATSRSALQAMISRGIRNGYIVRDGGIPVLTMKGRRRVGLVEDGQQMKDGNYFAVIYDIPQSRDHRRRQLAIELKSRGFQQYQRSFWLSTTNYTNDMKDIVAELGIGSYVTLGTFAKTFN